MPLAAGATIDLVAAIVRGRLSDGGERKSRRTLQLVARKLSLRTNPFCPISTAKGLSRLYDGHAVPLTAGIFLGIENNNDHYYICIQYAFADALLLLLPSSSATTSSHLTANHSQGPKTDVTQAPLRGNSKCIMLIM